MPYGNASMLLLGEGSEATEPYNKHDKIRPHSIRSLQFDQKVRPLSFRPETFDLSTATSRRKPQAREINRQYREFGKKVCKEAWRRDAVSQYRRLLLEVRPDLKPKWRVVESDDEPLSELKKKIELEHLIEEELQAEAAQGASTSY